MGTIPAGHVVASALPLTIGGLTLLERLGAGGMAEVFLASIGGREERVVVKRILPHLAGNAHYQSLFRREASTGARVIDKNVVRTLELVEDPGGPMIVLEYVDGLTLRAVAKAAWHAKLPVPVPVVLRFLADACKGLEAIHRTTDERGLGFVHRDVSPDNLIVGKDGVTRVLDFGVARPGGDGPLTRTGEIRGKIAFMPPEQIEAQPLDGRADLYALGVTTFWMLAGRRPFRQRSDLALMQRIINEPAPKLRTKAPHAPVDVEALVEALLQKDPADRPANARVVHDAFVAAGAARTLDVAFFLGSLAVAGAKRDPTNDAPSGMTPIDTLPRPGDVTPSVVDDRLAQEADTDRDLPRPRTRAKAGTGAPAHGAAAAAANANETAVGWRGPRARMATGSMAETFEPIAATASLDPSSEWRGDDVEEEDDESAPSTARVANAQPNARPKRALVAAAVGLVVLGGTTAAVALSMRGTDVLAPSSSASPSSAPSSSAPSASAPSSSVATSSAPSSSVASSVATSSVATSSMPSPSALSSSAPSSSVATSSATSSSMPSLSAPSSSAPPSSAPTSSSPTSSSPTSSVASSSVPMSSMPTSSAPSSSAAPSSSTPSSSAAPAGDANASVESADDDEPQMERGQTRRRARPPKKSPPKAPEKAASVERIETRAVRVVNAPKSAVWSAGGASLRGSGTLAVPIGTRALKVRLDDLDGDIDVPVDDVIDWTSLPRGDLSVRSLSQVSIFVGKRSFGVTPREDIPLVAGRYRVRLVHQDGREEKRIVEVTGGRVVLKVAQ